MTKRIKSINDNLNITRTKNKGENKPEQFNHPIFCLKFLHKDYHLNTCTKAEKASLVDKIYSLSQMTWQEIHQAPKHGFGSEKIVKVNAQLNSNFTPDETLYALRFCSKAPMVGIKRENIFYILYLDRKFTLYDHG